MKNLIFPILLWLCTTTTAQATHIAVLLPEHGPWSKAASAIQAGLLAAYYEDPTLNHTISEPTLAFYDTSSAAIVPLYQKALNEGAEAVIGPVQPELIHELVQGITPLPLTTLVLQSNISTTDQTHLWSVGIDLQSQLQQQVRLARQKGAVQLAIIHATDPEDDTLTQLLTQLWEQQGGHIAVNTTLPEHGSLTAALKNTFYSTSITHKAIHHKKHGRHHHSRLINVYTQKPRTIDAVFLLVPPRLSHGLTWAIRLSKPNTPVFILTQSWTDTKAPPINWSLLEIPWLDHPDSLLGILQAAIPPVNRQDLRWMALGADSWSLIVQLMQPGSLVSTTAHTGMLLNRNHALVRVFEPDTLPKPTSSGTAQ